MTLTCMELFAGAGGMALGLSRAGIQHSLLIDNDKDCVSTLHVNRPEWNVIYKDIREVDYSGMSCDIISGGFPCQSFSHAGKRLGFEDTRGTLFYEFARAVKQVRPPMFIAENVPGLKTHDSGRTFKTVLHVLHSIGGYDITCLVLNAAVHGVPQRRKRLFIVGHRPVMTFRFPRPGGKVLTVRDALEGVPPSAGYTYSDKKRKVMDLVPSGGCWVDLPNDVAREYMGKSYFSGGGRRGCARRLHWDEPCHTLTTSPSQKLTERCHPDETRPLTVREYARIQTIPDDWEICGSISSQYRQIGNAVPVELAYRIGIEIIQSFNYQ